MSDRLHILECFFFMYNIRFENCKDSENKKLNILSDAKNAIFQMKACDSAKGNSKLMTEIVEHYAILTNDKHPG